MKASLLPIAFLAAVGCAKSEASTGLMSESASPVSGPATSLKCHFYAERWDESITTNNKWVDDGKSVDVVVDLSKGYNSDSPTQVGSSTMTLSITSDKSQGVTLYNYILMVYRGKAVTKVLGSFLDLNKMTSLQAQLITDNAKSGVDCGSYTIEL